jgi:hypothetical protein
MPISSRTRTETRLPTARCGALVVVIVLPVLFVVVIVLIIIVPVIVVPVVIIPIIVVVIIIDSDGWGRVDRCGLGWWRGGFGLLGSYRLLRGHRFLRFI